MGEMANWAGEPGPEGRAALDALLAGLLEEKGRGWSAVRGTNEVVLRPPDRGLGKFGVTRRGESFRIAFFDRRSGTWTQSTTVPGGADAPATLLAWAASIVQSAGGEHPAGSDPGVGEDAGGPTGADSGLHS